MYIRDLYLENVRNIKGPLKINFDAAEGNDSCIITHPYDFAGKPEVIDVTDDGGVIDTGFLPLDQTKTIKLRNITVIIAKNGAAKTTILESIAFAFLDSSERFHNWGNKDYKSFRIATHNSSENVATAHIKVNLWDGSAQNGKSTSSKYTNTIEIKTITPQPTDISQTSKLFISSTDSVQKELGYVCAHGITRNLKDQSYGETQLYSHPKYPLLASVSPLALNLYTKHRDLVKTVREREQHAAPATTFHQHLSQFLTRFMQTLEPDLRAHIEVSDDFVLELVDTQNQIRTHNDYLPSGYASVLCILIDIVFYNYLHTNSIPRVSVRSTPPQFTPWPDPKSIKGIALIDELDLHLNPKWQVKILDLLAQEFPLMQWIVTTHSPLLLYGRKADEIVRLKLQDGFVVRDEEKLDAPELLNMRDIAQEYFGVDANSKVKSLIDEYRVLYRKNMDTPNDASPEEHIQMREKTARLRQHLLQIGVDVDRFESIWG